MNYEGYRNYHSVNLEAQTASVSPVQLVLVLLDGLLEELARARGHLEHQRFEQKGVSINKCIEILNGLTSALDFEAGGEVVANLARLYDYCAFRLFDASHRLDASVIDEVVRLLGTIRGGWQGVQRAHE